MIADLVVECYEIRGLTTSTLLDRVFNDTYPVGTAAGERFVLRVSGHCTRGPETPTLWEMSTKC